MFWAKAALSKASRKIAILAFGVLLYAAPNPALAGTTTEDFLKWERKSQDAFFQNSITMAGVIAAQSKPKVSKCIDEWYFESTEIKQQRHQEILDFMPNLKSYSPSTVILAILNDVCGKI
ncbi:MAG: hypothetical protein AAGJ35_11520 [Myxococcota bacterium]